MDHIENTDEKRRKRPVLIIIGVVVAALAALLILLGMALGRGHGEPTAPAPSHSSGNQSAAPSISAPTVEDDDSEQPSAEAKKDADEQARKDLIRKNNERFGDMKKQYADLNTHEYEIFTICSMDMPSHKLYRQLEDMQPFSPDTGYFDIGTWDMTQTDKLEAMRPVMAEYDKQVHADYKKCQSGEIELHDVAHVNEARQKRHDEAAEWMRKQH